VNWRGFGVDARDFGEGLWMGVCGLSRGVEGRLVVVCGPRAGFGWGGGVVGGWVGVGGGGCGRKNLA